MIPFSPPYINDDVISNVTDSLKSGWITTGPKVKALQEEIASLASVENVLCINSATSGLMLVLHWFGVGPGDEVIIPAYTYAATALSILHLGAKPVMVDVNDDFCIDYNVLKSAITEKTKVIIPVDLGGMPCDYDEIYKVINLPEIKNIFHPENENQKKLQRILVLSDAAHSIGAVYKGKPSGSLCDFTVFSLHAVKNVTSAEGGAICVNLPPQFDNKEIFNFLKLISLNGQTKDAFSKTVDGSWKYDIVYAGFKINMPDVLAAIALSQIKIYKNDLIQRRKEIFKIYDDEFRKTTWAILPPQIYSDTETSYHVYLLRIRDISEKQRDMIIEEISKCGVSVNVHFQPLPLLTLFKKLGYDINNYPVSYKNYSCEISLPIYPQLSNENVKLITEVVCKAYGKIKNQNK